MIHSIDVLDLRCVRLDSFSSMLYTECTLYTSRRRFVSYSYTTVPCP